MKKLILSIAMGLVGMSAYAQEVLSFSKVVQLDSTQTKNLIYQDIHTWFSTTYNSANSVIQMADKDAGIIIGKGSFSYSYPGLSYSCYSGYINYTIKVIVKDGKYKVEVGDFTHKNLPTYASSCDLGLITSDLEYNRGSNMQKRYNTNVWVDIKTKVDSYSKSLINDLEIAIKNGVNEDF